MARRSAVPRLISVCLSLILLFQPLSLIVPARALAASSAEASDSGQTADGNPVVDDNLRPEPPVADFSESLTKGIGFRFSSGEDFVDFRLDDLPGASPLTLGNITSFDSGDVSVKYTTGSSRVKEEIILKKKPASNTLRCQPRQEGFSLFPEIRPHKRQTF